jgi:hypothetical protein
MKMKFRLTDLLFAVVPIVLSVVGALGIGADSRAMVTSYTYHSSPFDVYVNYPSESQIASFEKDASVRAVVPYHNFELSVNGPSSSKNVSLLLSKESADKEVGFFDAASLIKGDMSSLVVDQIAADALGVGVGSSLSWTMGSKTLTRSVSGIAMPVYFGGLSFNGKGVIQGVYDSECQSAFASPLAYQMAFIASKDLSQTKALLSDYKPYGQVISYEEFKTDYEKSYRQGSYSDEEWTSIVTKAYNVYLANWSAGTFPGSVVYKDESDAIYHVSENAEASVAHWKMISLVVGFLSALVETMLILLTNHKDKTLYSELAQNLAKKEISSGLILKHSLFCLSSGLLALLVSSIAAFAQLRFFSVYWGVILPLFLLPLLGCGVAFLADTLYCRQFVMKKPEPATPVKEIPSQTPTETSNPVLPVEDKSKE